jgi:hypothetical protein
MIPVSSGLVPEINTVSECMIWRDRALGHKCRPVVLGVPRFELERLSAGGPGVTTRWEIYSRGRANEPMWSVALLSL